MPIKGTVPKISLQNEHWPLFKSAEMITKKRRVPPFPRLNPDDVQIINDAAYLLEDGNGRNVYILKHDIVYLNIETFEILIYHDRVI